MQSVTSGKNFAKMRTKVFGSIQNGEDGQLNPIYLFGGEKKLEEKQRNIG